MKRVTHTEQGHAKAEPDEQDSDHDVPEQVAVPIPEPPQEPPSIRAGSNITTIVAVVTFYFVSSISLVFLNKALLKNFEFELPLFMTWFQLIVALVVVGFLGWVGKAYSLFTLIPPLEFDLTIARHIAPLTIVFVAMIAFSNLTLRFAAVSFYQVVRSLTICFSIVFTWLLLNKTTSWRAIQACVVVIIGFAMGVKGEADVEDFSWLSVVFGVGSSIFVALYGIYVRKVNPYVDDNEWRLIIYNTILAIFMLFPIVFVSGELDMLAQSPLLFDAYFWFVMVFTGVIGILINIATFLQIKHTSPLTHNLSGTAKACLQTALSVLIWQNTVTTMNALGIVLVFAGSFWYTQIRYQEMQEQRRREAEAQEGS